MKSATVTKVVAKKTRRLENDKKRQERRKVVAKKRALASANTCTKTPKLSGLKKPNSGNRTLKKSVEETPRWFSNFPVEFTNRPLLTPRVPQRDPVMIYYSYNDYFPHLAQGHYRVTKAAVRAFNDSD